MRSALTCTLAWLLAAAASAGEISFSAKPTAAKSGDGAKIRFASAASTDVEVAVLDAKGAVVRHMVAGMLGEKPPKPLKPGLAQEIEWDGKDDLGKPAAGGPFKVRVALGLKPRFDRVIGWSGQSLAGVNGVAVGPDGALYVVHSGGLYAHRHTWLVSAFDKDGKYLREVYPGPANLPAEKRKGWPRIKPDDGPEVPVVHHLLSRTTYPGAAFSARMFPVVTGDGRIILLSASGNKYSDLRGGRRLLILGIDGSVPENFLGPEVCPQVGGFGHLALSSDGKTVYASGFVDVGRKGMAKGPVNVVYRVALDGSKPSEAFIGKPYEKLDGPGGLSDPQGIDIDKDGNIYVADYDHNRIAIFKPDGSYLDELKSDCPDTVRVSRKTGAVYVLQLKKRERNFEDEHYATPGHNWAARRIAKYGGLKDKAEKAAWENNYKFRYGGGGFLALDDSGAEPVLWAAGILFDGTPVLKLADRGGKLEVLGEPLVEAAKADKGQALGFVGDLAVVGNKIITQHPLYGQHGTFSLAYSAETGEYLGHYTPTDEKGKTEGEWTMTWGDAASGDDGLMYYLVKSNQVRRYDAEGKPLPFAAAGKHFLEGFWYGHTRGAGIFANREGTVWVPAAPADRQIEDVKIKVIGSDGKIQKDCALQVQGARIGGIAADRAGNVYIGAHVQPKDERVPKAFAGKLPADGPTHHPGYDYLHVGMLLKFPPEGGAIAFDEKGDHVATAQYARKNVTLKNVIWNRRLGYVGNHGHELGCHCETTRFDIDRYDRVFMPDPFRFRVCVLDSEGNELTSFGSYGNMDSRGPASPVPEPEIPFGWPLSVDWNNGKAYVADVVNRRIVAVKLDHAVEEVAEIR